jgi:hypothetical protein
MILILGFAIIWIDRRCDTAYELKEQKLKGMNPQEEQI